MILYFSGTGNSRYTAECLATILEDEIVSLGARIRARDCSSLISAKPWVFVAPIYGWRIPRLVAEHLSQTQWQGNRQAYFVVTCGDGAGNAARYAQKLCQEINLDFRGLQEVVMPENYIALFHAPSRQREERIVADALPVIAQVAAHIGSGRPIQGRTPGCVGRLQSSVVNPAFYRFIIKAKPFFATQACTGCGVCVQLCVCDNIRLQNGRPRWGKRCTHCMACINVCPVAAIEYGRRTRGKRRYFNTRCKGEARV